MRPQYLTPMTSGLAAYCYSHAVTQPSAAIAGGVFFTAWSILLIVKWISDWDSLQQWRQGYEAARGTLQKDGALPDKTPSGPHYSGMW